jgi:hypothetical protein
MPLAQVTSIVTVAEFEPGGKLSQQVEGWARTVDSWKPKKDPSERSESARHLRTIVFIIF